MSEEGLPPTHVRFWVSGESLRAACERVVLADDQAATIGRMTVKDTAG
jgi:hypothetical protein